jgi:hypothetical protein
MPRWGEIIRFVWVPAAGDGDVGRPTAPPSGLDCSDVAAELAAMKDRLAVTRVADASVAAAIGLSTPTSYSVVPVRGGQLFCDPGCTKEPRHGAPSPSDRQRVRCPVHDTTQAEQLQANCEWRRKSQGR